MIVALLRRHLQATPTEEHRLWRGDRWFMAALIAGLVALLVGMALAAWWTFAWLAGELWQLAR